MDPKVWSKLLTLHQRGYGVDVEALHDRCPLRRSSRKGPKWDLEDTEGYGGGNCVSLAPWMFSGYVGLYRRKKYVGGRLRGPRDRGAPYGGAPSYLVEASTASWLALQVLWITFVPKITLPKVSFRLDSVWYSFSSKYWNRQKNSNTGWASG